MDKKLAEQFLEKVRTFDLDRLTQLKGSYNRALAAGRPPLGDYRVDEHVYNELCKLIATKEREEAGLPLTPERSLKSEAEALAKAHGVSVGVAKRFLEKRDRSRGQEDTPRHRIESAPDPEPAEPSREQHRDRPELREWNKFGQHEKCED